MLNTGQTAFYLVGYIGLIFGLDFSTSFCTVDTFWACSPGWGCLFVSWHLTTLIQHCPLVERKRSASIWWKDRIETTMVLSHDDTLIIAIFLYFVFLLILDLFHMWLAVILSNTTTLGWTLDQIFWQTFTFWIFAKKLFETLQVNQRIMTIVRCSEEGAAKCFANQAVTPFSLATQPHYPPVWCPFSGEQAGHIRLLHQLSKSVMSAALPKTCRQCHAALEIHCVPLGPHTRKHRQDKGRWCVLLY